MLKIFFDAFQHPACHKVGASLRPSVYKRMTSDADGLPTGVLISWATPATRPSSAAIFSCSGVLPRYEGFCLVTHVVRLCLIRNGTREPLRICVPGQEAREQVFNVLFSSRSPKSCHPPFCCHTTPEHRP